jgi:preprotein translocase subunit YajC
VELIFILVAFLAFIIFSNRKRANAAKQLDASVAVGAEVVMLGGIQGKIVSILEDTVIVETTPGTRIRFVKAAVRTVVAPTLEDKPEPVKEAPAKKAPAATKKPATTKTTAKKTTTKTAAK